MSKFVIFCYKVGVAAAGTVVAGGAGAVVVDVAAGGAVFGMGAGAYHLYKKHLF